MDQCWNSVNSKPRNKLQWNLKRIYIFSWKKMNLKVSSAKLRPFCLGLNVLTLLHRIASSCEAWYTKSQYECTLMVLFIGFGLVSASLSAPLRLITLARYNDIIMSAMASQVTSLMIVYSSAYSGADQRKHQSSVSLAFVRGIHRRPVNSPHKWPVTRKVFSFGDVIMLVWYQPVYLHHYG